MTATEVQKEYLRLEPHLNRFAELGAIRLEESLDAHGPPLSMPVQARVKKLDSILGKIARKGERYTGVRSLPDLVGFRLIVAYRRELERACQVVEDTFRVDARETPHLQSDRFGYASIHLRVRPPHDWHHEDGRMLLPELVGEVQVRTLAQHLWAHASHDLQYKGEDDVPPILRRSLNRAAALLELVDIEFERVLAEREDFRKMAAVAGAADQELTAASIQSVLDSLWPASHRREREEYGFLLHELEFRGVADPEQLAKIIRKHRPTVLDYAQRYASRFLRNIEKHGLQGGELKISRPGRTLVSQGITEGMLDRLRQGVFFSHVALTSAALDMEFDGRNLEEDLLD